MSLFLVSIGPFDFNGFDVAVLIVLIISMLYAASRGFLREIISILALLVAAIVTLFVWGQFRFDIQGIISPSWLADGILILGVGSTSYLLMALLMARIGKTIAGKESGFVDRVLGAGFGIFRGLLIAALGVMAWTAPYHASLDAQEYRAQKEADGTYEQILDGMPKSMRDQMEAEPKELPPMLKDSTFYPLLNDIGNVIRALPFAKMKSYADRIKEGELDELAREITE